VEGRFAVNDVSEYGIVQYSDIAAIGTMAANYPNVAVERHWGSAATLLLPESQVVAVQGELDIFISPGRNDVFRLI
jgi:hypothetical protein